MKMNSTPHCCRVITFVSQMFSHDCPKSPDNLKKAQEEHDKEVDKAIWAGKLLKDLAHNSPVVDIIGVLSQEVLELRKRLKELGED